MDDAVLGHVLAVQVDAVDRRVRGAPAYLHESTEVRRAAQEVPALLQRHRLRFVAPMTPPTGKPQYLLRVAREVRDGGPAEAVLKVYGRHRPAEAALQSFWYAHRIPTPRVLASGDHPVSWLLLEHVGGEPVTIPSAGHALELTRRLATVMSRAHATGPAPVHGLRRLGDALLPHLDAVVAALAKHGYPVPRDWRTHARHAYEAGVPTTLHGDLTPLNMLRVGRELLLLDSCGYVGDPAFDAARWAVRISTPRCDARQVLATWLESARTVDQDVAASMLAVEALMQAGVTEIVKDERQDPLAYPDSVTEQLLSIVADVW